MKLLTNYKEYYDFLIKKFGIDEKALYERITKEDSYHGRTGLEGEHKMENNCVYAIAFCGKIVSIAKYEGKVHYGYDIDLTKISGKKVKETRDSLLSERDFSDQNKSNLSIHGEMTYINDKLNCPVILLKSYDSFVKDGSVIWKSRMTGKKFASSVRNPKLENFGIDKVIKPEDAFIQITNFLLREKEIENNQTDVEKVESHGFDKKRSFRPKMK